MAQKKVTLTLAFLTIVGAGLVLFFTFYPRLPRLNTAPHEGLGQAVAQEAIKLLGSGGRVVLIARDTATFVNPATDAQLNSFVRTLKRSGARIGATNLIKLDPLRVMSVPPGDFFQILKKGSDADVVVSFLGPPILSDEQAGKLGNRAPKVVAVCSEGIPSEANLKRLFEQKMLQTAMISRRTFAASPPASSRPQNWFDYLFEVVTPANFSEWLAAPATRH
jgi:hypothetical protein